jgi:hypothetical protein
MMTAEGKLSRAVLILASLVILGCDNPVEPSPLYPSYFLSAVDDDPLPAPYAADGSVLLAGTLGFADLERPRTTATITGLVSYTISVRRPDQSLEQSTIELYYSITDGVLRINLCPPLALCIASTELVGPILGRNNELVLTYYLGGNPGSVYRYFPTLPD